MVMPKRIAVFGVGFFRVSGQEKQKLSKVDTSLKRTTFFVHWVFALRRLHCTCFIMWHIFVIFLQNETSLYCYSYWVNNAFRCNGFLFWKSISWFWDFFISLCKENCSGHDSNFGIAKYHHNLIWLSTQEISNLRGTYGRSNFSDGVNASYSLIICN